MNQFRHEQTARMEITPVAAMEDLSMYAGLRLAEAAGRQREQSENVLWITGASEENGENIVWYRLGESLDLAKNLEFFDVGVVVVHADAVEPEALEFSSNEKHFYLRKYRDDRPSVTRVDVSNSLRAIRPRRRRTWQGMDLTLPVSDLVNKLQSYHLHPMRVRHDTTIMP